MGSYSYIISMTPTRAFDQTLLALTAQWRVMGLLAVTFAREILRLERAGDRSAGQKADLLEAWLGAAVFTLTRQIAHASNRSQTGEAARALQHMQVIASALMMLTIFIQRLKRRLATREDIFAESAVGSRRRAGVPHRGYNGAVPILDSS